MKHISILIPETAVMEAVANPRYMFTAANDFLVSEGRQPFFDVQLVGLKKEIKLMNGLAAVHPDKHIKDVKKTDLIFIPALSGDMNEALAKNKDFIPWIIMQHKKGAEVASLCIGAFLLVTGYSQVYGQYG